MPAPERPLVDQSDDQRVRIFTPITLSFVGGMVLVLVLGVVFLVPHAPLTGAGAGVGVALALASWFGSRAATAWAASTAARRVASGPPPGLAARPLVKGGPQYGAAGAAGTIAFIGIGVGEGFGLVGLPIGLAMHDLGPFVIALPVAMVAVVLNASGPAAMRRHLQRVRGGRTD